MWAGGRVSAPASTQSRFDSWTTENGLPQNSILDILQTHDGYLWLATEGGPVRFDGARKVRDGALIAQEGAALIGSATSARTALGCS